MFVSDSRFSLPCSQTLVYPFKASELHIYLGIHILNIRYKMDAIYNEKSYKKDNSVLIWKVNLLR